MLVYTITLSPGLMFSVKNCELHFVYYCLFILLFFIVYTSSQMLNHKTSLQTGTSVRVYIQYVDWYW